MQIYNKNMEKVKKTSSGFYIRHDKGIGLLVFSPFTGLLYVVAEEFAIKTENWLNEEESDIPDAIKTSIGIGWRTAFEEAIFGESQLLPDKNFWNKIVPPADIITINWLFTGECNFECPYCFASDLMSDHSKEPNLQEVKKIAENILTFNPLFVVFTGGEPLCSPHFKEALKCLSGKVGIIVDTNGYNINEELVNYLKNEKVVVRISIDSQIPKTQFLQRKLKNAKNFKKDLSFKKIINNLCLCLDKQIPIVIQTVATKKNVNELAELGDKLYKLGIKVWRIQRIQESKLNKSGFDELMGKGKVLKKSYSSIEYNLNKISGCQKTRWNSKMAVRITMNHNSDKNAVILVSPDGKFYTESLIKSEKVLIDDNNPYQPKTDVLTNQINKHAHLLRYVHIK